MWQTNKWIHISIIIYTKYMKAKIWDIRNIYEKLTIKLVLKEFLALFHEENLYLHEVFFDLKRIKKWEFCLTAHQMNFFEAVKIQPQFSGVTFLGIFSKQQTKLRSTSWHAIIIIKLKTICFSFVCAWTFASHAPRAFS